MHDRIVNGATIAHVAEHPGDDRRYRESYADHARGLLREYVDEAGSETAAGRLLGVNQSTIGRNLKPDKQPSLRVIIALAEKTSRTVDEVLGIRRHEAPTTREVAEMRQEMASLKEHISLLLSQTPTPPSTTGMVKKR